MKLDRVHNIACIASAVFICLPFLLDWLITDIPRWGWQVMTVLIALSFGTMFVTYFMRKSRDWDKEHRHLPRRRRR